MSYRPALILVLIVLYWACATPKSPTGGPPDELGPTVISTKPETGTVNFEGRTFEFTFSEWVNRSSVEKELIVEPDLGLEYETKWKRKTFIVEFTEELPEETTIILTLGAKLTDISSNRMGEPVRLAVSTGDEIDSGEITGQIRDAETGEVKVGQRVLLYRFPATFQDKATYVAETDTGGTFRFQYLREGRYQMLAVEDRNLNKAWEPQRETARPFRQDIFTLAKEQKDTLDVMYWFSSDTTRPVLQAVGLLSSYRLRLRFSEEVVYTDSVDIVITDTLGNPSGDTFPLYVSERDPFIGFAYNREGTLPTEQYKVEISGITDRAGNPAVGLESAFSGSAQSDTVRQRIHSTNAGAGLFPETAFEVSYTGPITQRPVIDSLVVAEGEVTFDDWPNLRVQNNRLIIPPQDRWIDGTDYQFLVWNPATNRRQMFNPEIWTDIKLGGIEVRVPDTDSLSTYHLILENQESNIRIDTTFSQLLSLDDLPPLAYKLKIFEDLNGNGEWDYGSIDPFRTPEPYYVQQTVNVQQGFTSEVIISFN